MSIRTKSTRRIYVGSYARLHGKGLYALVEDGHRGWRLEEPFADVQNASFGLWSPRHHAYYLLDEERHAVGVFRRGDDGWHLLGRVETNGAEPCHLALDGGDARLAIANYGSGSLTLLALDPTNGLPVPPEQVHRGSGSGPDKERQEGPHAHWVGFHGDALFQTDLGNDSILAFEVAPDGALGEPTVAYAAPAGSGPRFLCFAPQRAKAYLVSELASTLTTFDVSGNRLTERAIVSTLPAGFAGESLGGHIVINPAGDRLYVTNRGHDSIAIFALDRDGTATPMRHVSSGGASPRFMLLDPEHAQLLVANEEGGSVATFTIESDGTLSPSGAPVPVPGAVFLLR